ncbi:hypothetical protein V5740_04090 [Croceibacterium sp. TMG7-5b_MA50]|uniref:hypothetical protein n=1 Tax=Croceibacterium sp. TMG7-5b_MA50 TaxID=3121290 RepID=UPI003221F9B6
MAYPSAAKEICHAVPHHHRAALAPAAPVTGPLEPNARRCANVMPIQAADETVPGRRDGTAHADTPLLYKAVEHRLNGCSVLLMQTGELRHVPKIDPNRPLLVPAR